MKLSFLVIGFLCMMLLSCKNIFMAAYGIKKPRLLEDQEIKKKSESLGIDTQYLFILDKKYFSHLEQSDTLRDKNIVKCSPMISKYEQPLQVLYFDRKGQLVSFHNNCYASGFPKLKWNNNNQFDVFVPKTTIPITDSVANLSSLVSYLKPLYKIKELEQSEITIVVFWSVFMYKQSKELLNTVQRNLKLKSLHVVKVLYVNTDNCFVESKYSNQINQF